MPICVNAQDDYLGNPYRLRTLEDKYKDLVQKSDTLHKISLDRWVDLMTQNTSADSLIDATIDYLKAKEGVHKILITNPEYLINEMSNDEFKYAMRSMSDTLSFDEKYEILRVNIAYRSLVEAVKCNEFIKELKGYKQGLNLY